jgi:ribosomal protein L30/L7E
MPQIDFIVLTLTRGWAAKGRYQAVLRHLGLTRRGKTVQVPNTFEFRAAAKKVRLLEDQPLVIKGGAIHVG